MVVALLMMERLNVGSRKTIVFLDAVVRTDWREFFLVAVDVTGATGGHLERKINIIIILK